MQGNSERPGGIPETDWKLAYQAEYARVFGKRIKLVGGRTGVFKIKPEGGLVSRAGYRRADIVRMTEDLKARADGSGAA